MGTLSKQQTIILLIMVITILYGAYTYYPLLTKKFVHNVTEKEEDLNTFITGLNNDLSNSYPTVMDSYIISRAEHEWLWDPFSIRGLSKTVSITKETGKKSVASGIFNYSGFVITGNKKMAIINGNEYGEGDPLEKEGFVVEQISPTRVIIRNVIRGTTTDVDIKNQEMISHE